MSKTHIMVKRIILWFKIRWKLHRILMNNATAKELVNNVYNAITDKEVLKWIASRQCTAVRDMQCIELRPKDPNDWCCRCLALDHLTHRK